MKILYCITKSNMGGAQRYVLDLAVTYKQRGYECVVASGGQDILKDKLAHNNILFYEIEGLERDVKIRGDIRAYFSLIKIIKNISPDIVHLNSPKVAGIGSLAVFTINFWNFIRRKKRVRVVYTIHGWTWNEQRPVWQRGIIAFATWCTVFLSDSIIVLSKSELDEGYQLPFISKKRFALIRNGIPHHELQNREEARLQIASLLRKQKGELTDTIIIGSIGELHENKGYRFALNAIKRLTEDRNLPRFIYAIIGSGEKKDYLEELCLSLGIKDKVFFLDFVPNAGSTLPAFDLFLIPSLKEGLPYVLLEAGNAELPVITTNVGGIPDLIEDMTNGILVRPGDWRELYEGISHLLKHPEKMTNFGKNLKKTIEKKASFDIMVENTIKLYEPTPHDSFTQPAIESK